ncbi:hypothetical protein TNCV_1623431 [Trichonephila clavipes]|nr:hypothetical protein TNCV_1623431 [Trichonephila clavipes]
MDYVPYTKEHDPAVVERECAGLNRTRNLAFQNIASLNSFRALGTEDLQDPLTLEDPRKTYPPAYLHCSGPWTPGCPVDKPALFHKT